MPLNPELDPHFDEAARLNNLDPTLLRALALGESNGNRNAVGPPNATTSERALGLMQFLPSTARGLGVDPTDPVQAIYGAAQHLNDRLTYHEGQKDQNPNIVPVDEALKDYFAGESGKNRGPNTAGYPGLIATRYRQLAGDGQPAPPDALGQLAQAKVTQTPPPGQVAANFQPPAGTPDTLDAAPQGVAALAALSGQGTAPTPRTVQQLAGNAAPGAIQRDAGGSYREPRTYGSAAADQLIAQADRPSQDDLSEALRLTNELMPVTPAARGQQPGAAPTSANPGSQQVFGPEQILGFINQAPYVAGGLSSLPALVGDLRAMLPPSSRLVQDPSGQYRIEAIAGANDVNKATAAAKAAGEQEGALPGKITASRAEAAIKAGFDLKPAFHPETGLPGYVNGLGHFLEMEGPGARASAGSGAAGQNVPAGQPIVAENPYKTEQEAQRKDSNAGLETARNMRRLADDFVSEYAHINDPGYGQNRIQNLRKIGQQVFQLSGVPVPESLASTTSATEAANFISQQLVAQAAKEMSPRLAQQLVQQINQVKMSPTITPEGITKIHKLIYGATQEPIDRAQFVSDYYNGNTPAGNAGRMRNDAITQFASQYPSTSYNVIANGPFGPLENAKAVEVLRKNPGSREAFERRFGPGSAAMVLGQ